MKTLVILFTLLCAACVVAEVAAVLIDDDDDDDYGEEETMTMSKPKIDTMDGVIYHGEDIAKKRYKRTSEITQCPLWAGNSGCYYGTCMYHLSGDRSSYCCHPKLRKEESKNER